MGSEFSVQPNGAINLENANIPGRLEGFAEDWNARVTNDANAPDGNPITDAELGELRNSLQEGMSMMGRALESDWRATDVLETLRHQLSVSASRAEESHNLQQTERMLEAMGAEDPLAALQASGGPSREQAERLLQLAQRAGELLESRYDGL